MAVTAKIEQDDARLAGVACRHRLVDHCPDCVRRLGRGDDPLRVGKTYRGLECLVLPEGTRLDDPRPHQPAEERGIPVVAKTTRVDWWRDEVVSERVHRH